MGELENTTRGTVVCERVTVADRPLRRMRGLLGYSSLAAGEGLLLRPAPSIHTAFMRFPIDVIFLDRNSVVVRTVSALPPWRAAAARQARAALELAAGQIVDRGVQLGDRLEIRRNGHATVLRLPRESDLRAVHRSTERDHDLLRREELSVTRAPSPPADRTKLLLISNDRRFRAVMQTLLSARGFSVTVSPRDGEVRSVAERTGAEILVVELAGSLQDGRAYADAISMAGEVGLIFVTDGTQTQGAAAHVVAKWGSLEQLCAEIEAVHPNTGGTAGMRPAGQGAAGGSDG